jgi:hypothetical protein
MNTNKEKKVYEIISDLDNNNNYGTIEKYHIKEEKNNGYVEFVERDDSNKKIYAKKYSINIENKSIDYYVVNPTLEKGEIKSDYVFRLVKENGDLKLKKLKNEIEKEYVLKNVFDIELK